MFVFTLGGALGGSVAFPLAGAVYDMDVFSVVSIIEENRFEAQQIRKQ